MLAVVATERRLAAIAALALLAGCAGSGSGLDASGRPVSEGGGSNVLSADFNSLQANVFTPICTACHAGASAPLGLRLDAGNSYNLLVGVASSEVSSLQRVRPGDPDNSYLIQKLEGRAAVGAQMPLGGPALPATTIAFIRQWIANGAPRPAAATGGTVNAFLMTGVAPARGDSLQSAPPQVVVGFNSELNATRVDDGSVRLERLADDDSGAAERVAAAVRVPASNTHAIVVTPREALPAGRYRLVFDGNPGNVLTDLSGRPLAEEESTQDGGRLASEFEVLPGASR